MVAQNENSKLSILVVEDDPIQSIIILESMKAEGFKVDSAESGDLAFSKIKSSQPNIILLDMNLPDMDGLQFMSELKKIIYNEMIKIIVYSANDENSLVLQALSRGATDYAFKKDDPAILKARVNNIAKNITLNQKLNRTISDMQENLNLAREIQMSTIPNCDEYNKSEFNFNITYLPADFVSGDIYDIFQYTDRILRIFLADAPGHGIQAGFITMSIKTEYDRLKKIHSDITEIAKDLNKAIFNSFEKLTVYTCIILEIDLDKMTLTYTNSGHPTQILIQDEALWELPPTNPIVGFLKDLPTKKRSFPLTEDFRIYLFSDGIFEFFDKNGEIYGADRFQKLVWSLRNQSIVSFSSEILTTLYDTINHKGFNDDITLISVSLKNSNR